MKKSEIPYGPIKNCLVFAYSETQNSIITLDAKVFWWPPDPEYFDTDGPLLVKVLADDTLYTIYWKNLIKITDKNGNKFTRKLGG